jgi:hypothetical protein
LNLVMQGPPVDSTEMKEQILQLLSEFDTFAVMAFVASQDDAMAAVQALDDLMRDQYWKQKQLASTIALGRIGAQHALASAERIEAANADLAFQLRCKAKGFCYNLASFTWSGWREPEIEISPADEAIGLDAARANLRLAQVLSRGDLPMSRAHWMLGGQLISAGAFAQAIENFEFGARFAQAAGSKDDELLCIAFARLAHRLAHPESGEQQVTQAVEELKSLKDGESFANQVTTALDVFAKRESLAGRTGL